MRARSWNHYCSRCLQTRRFYDVEDHRVCERCRKRLHKVLGASLPGTSA